jgi:hypothetical protein
METPASLEVHPAPHPRLGVHRAGFPLDNPYLEQCWIPVLGPSSVLLLRRVPWLWRDATPAEVDVAELGAQLGLRRGGRPPQSHRLHSRADRAIPVRRLVGTWCPGRVHRGPTAAAATPRSGPAVVRRAPRGVAERHLEGLGRRAGGVAPAAVSPFRTGSEARG